MSTAPHTEIWSHRAFFVRHLLTRHLEFLTLLLLLGFGLINLSWGLPESWPSDEVSWIVDRMLVNNTMNTGWFYYPNLMMNVSYVATRLVGLPILSGLGWDQLYIVGYTTRLVSLSFYILTAWFISRAVAGLFGLRRAPFAFFFVGTIGALNHHAHLGTVSSALFFGIALSVYFILRVCKSRSELDFYSLVAAIGLAVGAKYNGAFLAASLPILWFVVFRGFSGQAWLRSILVSSIVGVASFLATTPYALMDYQGFVRDVNGWLTVEGPAFSQVSPTAFIRFLGKTYVGFFTVGVLGIMVVSVLACSGALIMRSGNTLQAGIRTKLGHPISLSLIVLWIVFLSYQVISFRVGIYQSRHFLPGALIFTAMFLISWYFWKSALDSRAGRARSTMLAVAGIIAVSALVNTYIHVWVFSASAKSQALAILSDIISADPRVRIEALAMPSRSPFQRGVLDDHVGYFYVDDGAYEAETWNEYLGVIGDHFASLNSDYLVIEDSVFNWPVFRPKRFALDYGKRLNYPNPGRPAWNTMLEGAGYRQLRVIRTGMYEDLEIQGRAIPGTRGIFRIAETLIGSQWRTTTEGVGERVYLYEKVATRIP